MHSSFCLTCFSQHIIILCFDSFWLLSSILWIYSIAQLRDLWVVSIYLFLSITNKSVMNIHIQVFPWTYSFTSLWKIPKGGMTGSYERCVFNCLRSCLFSKKVAQFDVGFLSHQLLYSSCVLRDWRDISLQVIGVTDALCLKRKPQQNTRITSYIQPAVIIPIVQKKKRTRF